MKSKANALVLAVLTVMVLMVLSSCTVQTTVSPGVAPPPPPPPPAFLSAEGQPNFHAGLRAGYWIWHDRGGWHLRVTTGGARVRFRGTVEAAAGFIRDLHATRLEWSDRVVVEGGRIIRFDFWAQRDVDGFDWRSHSGCNLFNLYINDAPVPERIFVGAFSQNPLSAAFEACP